MIGAVKGLTSFGGSIVDMASHFEQTQKSLETLLQSSEKGKELFENLRTFSFKTTFGVDELASASSQLLNAGVAVNDLQKRLKMLGDVAQGDKAKFAELSGILAKVELMGKAGAQTLAQFNIRGVPLNKTLKEMGVVGVASAQDVTRALEILTDEGGQFHNAMDNIIDTIEGKRGFIEDTQKEILVNLGQATGITDTYKAMLDLVYGALDKINNVLMWINQNPIVKALVTGVFTTLIVGLTHVILANLIPAIVKVIAKLTVVASLKSVISPLSLVVGGLTVGFGLLTSAMDSFSEEQEEVADKTDAVTGSLERLHKVTQLEFFNNVIQGENATLKSLQTQVKELEKKKRELEGRTNSAFANKDSLTNSVDYTNSIAEFAISKGLDFDAHSVEEITRMYLESMKKTSDSTVSGIEKEVESLNKEIKARKELLEIAQHQKDAYELSESLIANEAETQLKNLTGQLDTMLKAYEEEKKIYLDKGTNKGIKSIGRYVDLYPELKKQYDKAIDKLNKDIKKIEVQIYLASKTENQDFLQKLFGFTDEQMRNIKTSGQAIATYKNLEQGKVDRTSAHADFLSITQETILEKQIKDAKAKIQELEEYGDWSTDNSKNKNAESINAWIAEIKSKEEELKQIKIGKVAKKLNDDLQKLNPYQKQLKDSLQSIGVDFTDYDEMFDKYLQGEGMETLDTGTKELFDAIKKKVDSERTFVDDLQDKYKVLLGDTDTLSKAFSTLGIGFTTTIVSTSHDLEAFAQGFASSGSWIGGVIAVVVEALANVCQGLEGFDEALNPITYLFSKLSVLIEFLMHLIIDIVKIIGAIAKILNTILKIISPILKIIEALVDALADLFDGIADGFEAGVSSIFGWVSANDEETKAKEEEAERLRRLNEQYTALYDSMREQERYYLEKKMAINASSYSEGIKRVNDMILTPKGTFSTSPQDTILAMKHPENLMNGGKISVQINNYTNDNVETSADANGNLIVNISRKIAQDYADGSNGWENAYQRRSVSMQGKAYSI